MTEQVRVTYGSVDTVVDFNNNEAEIKGVLAETYSELRSSNARAVWGRGSDGVKTLTFALSEGRKAAEQVRVTYGSVDTVVDFNNNEAEIKGVLAETYSELRSSNARAVWGRGTDGVKTLTFALSEGRKAAEQVRVTYGSVDTVVDFNNNEAEIKGVLAETYSELRSSNARAVWGRGSDGVKTLTFALSEGRKA